MGNAIAVTLQRSHEEQISIRSQAAVESPARRVPSKSNTAIWVEPGRSDPDVPSEAGHMHVVNVVLAPYANPRPTENSYRELMDLVSYCFPVTFQLG